MKLVRITWYQLESRVSIFPITKLSFNSENIVIYKRQMSHYEIYYYNSIIFILLSVGMSRYNKRQFLNITPAFHVICN